ncbi:MAG: hypothetical protein R3E39_16955 [Anaerolineae bacterium]
MMSKRRDDWLDENEYPDDRDVDELGDDSPVDYDRLTMGRIGSMRQPFWTRGRIIMAVFVLIILFSLLAAVIAPLLRR